MAQVVGQPGPGRGAVAELADFGKLKWVKLIVMRVNLKVFSQI